MSKINFNYITYLFILTLFYSCSENSDAEKNQDGTFSEQEAAELADLLESSNDTINSGIVEESIIGELSPGTFDSTVLIGTWVVHDSDLAVLDYPYVENMPNTFQINDLNQIKHGSLKAKFDNSSYPFSINKIDASALSLQGGYKKAPDIISCPRGSNISPRRIQS